MARAGILKWAAGAVTAAGAAAAWVGWVQPWYRHWGASREEVEQPMFGDDVVMEPNVETTRAVEIEAGPMQVWPWLAQLGAGRGGAYSYDWLEQLFGFLDEPSANEILPEYQHIHRGDVIPFAREGGFRVEKVSPGRAMTLVDLQEEPPYSFSWTFQVVPVATNRTRLVSRGRARVGWSMSGVLFRAFIDPAAFIMERKMLLGIKERAERIARHTERALEEMSALRRNSSR